MKPIIKAILEESLKDTIFQHLIPYNPGLRIFSKNSFGRFDYHAKKLDKSPQKVIIEISC